MSKSLQFACVAALALVVCTPLAAQDQCVPVFCADQATCEVPIFGGQTIPAGTVTIDSDDTLLYIEINTTGGWEFDQVHIYVGHDPVPTNGGGNPSPGQFPYGREFSAPVSSHLAVFTLSELGIDPTAPDCVASPLNIVVHTALINVSGQEETGFAYGETAFRGRRWGWSLCYAVECQNSEPER